MYPTAAQIQQHYLVVDVVAQDSSQCGDWHDRYTSLTQVNSEMK